MRPCTFNPPSSAATPGSIIRIESGTRLGGSEPSWYQLVDEAGKPAGEVQLGFELIATELEKEDAMEFCFSIQTDPQGFNFGRIYTQKCKDEEDAAAWVDVLSKAVKDACSRKQALDLMRAHGHSRFSMLRARAAGLEQSAVYQYSLALIILVAFVVDIAEAQMAGDASTHLQACNLVLAVVFMTELLIVCLANSNEFRSYWSDMGHVTDFFVTVVCVVQAALQYIDSDMPSLKVFRMLRVLRVTRIFHRFRSLRRLIMGLQHAAVPVLNALFILLIFTSMYASIGTHVFRDQAPQYFTNFTTSLFTLIQCLSGDSWASGVSRSIFLQQDSNNDIQEIAPTDWSVGIFFVSYYAFATVVLLNVVVAVLLDEFITSMRQEEEERAAEERRLRDLGRYRGVLDPVTASLTDFEDKSHLCTKIDQLYERLDVDSSGGLDFDEMQQGIRRLPGGAKVHITRDDFDVISQHWELLGPGGDFGKSQFQDMMLGELLRYSHRKVLNMLQDTEQEEFRALVLLIKMMEVRQGDIAWIMTMQEQVLTHLRVDAGKTPRTEVTQENPFGPVLHADFVHVHATATIGQSKRAPEDPALSVEPMSVATPSEGTAHRDSGGKGS